MQNRELRIYIKGTLFAALAMVLSWIPSGIGSSYSVSLGMIPLTFFAGYERAEHDINSWRNSSHLADDIQPVTVSLYSKIIIMTVSSKIVDR